MVWRFFGNWGERLRECRALLSFLQSEYSTYRRLDPFKQKFQINIPRTVIFTGDLDSISIGTGTHIGESCVFRFRHGKISIGKYVLFANNITVAAGTHSFEDRDLPIMQQPAIEGEITIGDKVWIGANVVILSNVTIGEGAIIGAGSVVSKDIPPYQIWGGLPAQYIKDRP